jgi:uncharacterized tellurite resistance protein B-like protein
MIMFEQLSRDDRLLLLRFVCAFAWTDLEIRDGERKFVERLVQRMQLSAEDRAEVAGYLHVAPAPGSTSPALVPREHRRVFIDSVRALIYADGEVDAEERDRFERLRAALSD